MKESKKFESDGKSSSVAVKENVKNRIKVANFDNSIYNDLTFSNGKKISDVLSDEIEIPVTGSVGINHIEEHKERQGLFEKYKEDFPNIINNPDYIFEALKNEDTLLISKKIDKNAMLVIKLSYKNLNHTNSLLTMWEMSDKRFERTKRSYSKKGKILYKKST